MPCGNMASETRRLSPRVTLGPFSRSTRKQKRISQFFFYLECKPPSVIYFLSDHHQEIPDIAAHSNPEGMLLEFDTIELVQSVMPGKSSGISWILSYIIYTPLYIIL